MIHYLEILGLLIAYLLGSIPSSVWIGKTFYHTDVREHGSGNAGATNTLRVLGWKAGLPVLVFDVLKGWLAIYLGNYFFQSQLFELNFEDYQVGLAIFAVLGHIFPVFAGFKGGKGIATLLGMGIAIFPIPSLMAVVIFVIILLLTRYVSLGSLVATITFPINEIFILGHNEHNSHIFLAIAVGIFAIITHRKNINRLFKGEESKINFKQKNS